MGYAGIRGWSASTVPAVEEWLAAQAAGDVAGLAHRLDGGRGAAVAGRVLGVVQQAVGQVVGGPWSRRLASAAAEDAPAARSPSAAARRARTRPRSARSIGAMFPG